MSTPAARTPVSFAKTHDLPGLALRLALALGVLLAIWLPHYTRFHIDRAPVGADVADVSLRQPATSVLDEIAAMRFAIRLELPPEKRISVADAATRGTVELPVLNAPMPLLGFPADLHVGSSSTQLILASLGLERLLLDAYDTSHDPRYKQLALKRVLDFAAYEGQQRTSSDFLWNDHAIAARISVLAHLWRTIRDDPAVTAAEKGQILSLVQRSGRLLAKPGLFTVRTNHGVMQNLGLLQIGAAFPALPEAPEWRRLGLERLHQQAGFYVSPEGFVLEHSGEYHAFGAELLTQAVRLCVLNGMPPPEWLVRDAQLSAGRLAQLIRPDGSLPLIGNTSAGSRFSIPDTTSAGQSPIHDLPPPTEPDTRAPQLLPLSGYAIWWNRDKPDSLLSQTVINWSKHDGHGHKHADEGALQLWADGSDWLTSTGYWPYDTPNMADAYGWASSNAPHRIGEGRMDKRDIALLGHISGPHLRAVDLERRNADGARYRRQIVQLDASTLLVLDFAAASGTGTETIWTLAPHLDIDQTAPGHFVAHAPGKPLRLGISLDTPPSTTMSVMRGSRAPFAGWVVSENQPTPSYALRVLTPAPDSVSGALFTLGPADAVARTQLRLAPGTQADNWQASVTVGGETRTVRRKAGQLSVSSPPVGEQSYDWSAPEDIGSAAVSLKTAYATAVAEYPPSRDLSTFRLKLSYLIAGLAVGIELAWRLLVCRYAARPRQRVLAGAAIAALWAAFAAWALGVYLH
jgi:hypothetical protein